MAPNYQIQTMANSADSRIEKVLFTAETIAERINQLAFEIDTWYENYADNSVPLVLVGILKGSYMFLADLSRALNTPHHVDFMSVSSYEDTQSTGNLKIECDLRHSIKGKYVIIVEDIVDTGRTLAHLQKLLSNRGPYCLEVATLFSKPTERVIDVHVSYIGFELDPPEFIVGYGLDYNEHFRDLPYVGVPTQTAILELSHK